MENTASIESYLKDLPWKVLIVSLVISTICFILAIYICNLGGGWIIIGVLIGIPSLLTILQWIKRIIGLFNSIVYLRKLGVNWTSAKKESSPDLMLQDAQELEFKDNQAAFEYMCEYIQFEEDMLPGIVTHIEKLSSDYSTLTLNAIISDKVMPLSNSINLLGQEVKIGDIVVCLHLPPERGSKIIAAYLLAPKFNIHKCAWIVAKKWGDSNSANVTEIPVRHLGEPRSL